MKNRKMLSIYCSKESSAANGAAGDTVPASCRQMDEDCVVYCKHANRLVSDQVCVVYREQISETGQSACAGCIIDAVLYRPTETARDGMRYYNA